jgi:hypothetical protein
MGDKDSKFTFVRPEVPVDRDPTVRDVHRLELEQTSDETKPVGGFNPYDRDVGKKAPATAPTQRTGTTTRTDLRKLSEWIKLRQEIEARKSSEPGEPGKTSESSESSEPSEAERVPTVRIPKPKF